MMVALVDPWKLVRVGLALSALILTLVGGDPGCSHCRGGECSCRPDPMDSHGCAMEIYKE